MLLVLTLTCLVRPKPTAYGRAALTGSAVPASLWRSSNEMAYRDRCEPVIGMQIGPRDGAKDRATAPCEGGKPKELATDLVVRVKGAAQIRHGLRGKPKPRPTAAGVY
jgi:hypothetical protein